MGRPWAIPEAKNGAPRRLTWASAQTGRAARAILATARKSMQCGRPSRSVYIDRYGLDLRYHHENLLPGAGAAQPVCGGSSNSKLGACAAACAHSKLDSGVETGSRLGFSGRESLGDDTSAVFTLEEGIQNDTGKADQNGRLFGRQAFVGLDSAHLGALTLGRQYNLQYQVLVDVADPFKGGLAGTATNLMGYSVMRYDNSIKYVTPSSHGWSAAALYSFGESPNSSATNRAYGASLGYADGPVNVSVAHQRKDNPGDFSSGDNVVDQSASNTLVAANFKVGVATAYAAFGRDKGVGSSPWDASNPYGALVLATPSNDSRDMLAGLSLPVGATTFMASYIHKDDRSILNQDADQLAVGMTYALSRRTDFYAAVAKIHNKNGAGYTVGNATSAGHGDRAINAGIRFSF